VRTISSSRVLLAFSRSLLIEGLPQYDYVSDAARDQITTVAEKVGPSDSAQILASAIRSGPSKDRRTYVLALGFLELRKA
jgi:hypothetical protein